MRNLFLRGVRYKLTNFPGEARPILFDLIFISIRFLYIKSLKMKQLFTCFSIILSLYLFSCTSSSDSPILQSGTWRATLTRDGQALPFQLDIESNSDGSTYSAWAVNGEERFKMDTAYVENDSLHILSLIHI